LAIENNELIHHLAEEEAHRERLNREIEIAQEVQAKLFPQVYPEFEGVDLAGFCRTAQQIGGDYYDFIAMENGRLGIAVGDISGKGISAALLMASMRASLRGLTLSGSLDLAGILQRMNLISYDSSTSNRFATFFFAEYDRATRQLDYVNAGHNAPALLRRVHASGNRSNHAPGDQPAAPGGGYQVQRLEIGGPVMGVFPEVHYEQGKLAIEPEDVLIAFTDGLSEAMTAGYEEWGEKRLIEAAQKCAHLPAREIVSSMVAEADSFTAGAAQNDDLTMVVVKFF
jgi:phosphoserine phosphatase RsbU/P